MNTKKLFSNTMFLRNAKKLSCNTKKLLWITKTVYGIERGYSGISRSFYVIPRSPYPGAFKEYQEALSNTMKLDGIPRRIPRTCPEIRRSSLEYQEALTKNPCKFVPRFRPYKVRGKRLRDDANPGQGQAQMPWNGTRKVAQGHPKRTKMVRNSCQNVPRSKKWRPAVKL